MKKIYLEKRKKNLKNFCSKNFVYLKVLVFFIFLIANSNAFSNENITAKNQVDNLIKDLTSYHNKNSNSKNKKKKIDILKYINLDFMARATTGKYWNKVDEKDRNNYKELLLKKILNTIDFHTKKLEEYTFVHKKVDKRGNKLIYVKGILKNKDNEKINITWKMYSKNLTIIDLEIEKISLIKTQKSETMSLLRKNKGNFKQFLKQFDNKKKL